MIPWRAGAHSRWSHPTTLSDSTHSSVTVNPSPLLPMAAKTCCVTFQEMARTLPSANIAAHAAGVGAAKIAAEGMSPPPHSAV